MFQFGGFAFPCGNTAINCGGLPHSDIRGSAPLAGPRGFSQLITSFFASGSLGIPRAPLFTYSLHISAFCSGYMHSLCPDPIAWTLYSVAFSAQHVNELVPASCDAGYGNVKTNSKAKTGFQKGGVPAAPSGTATLLRLSPSYRFYP